MEISIPENLVCVDEYYVPEDYAAKHIGSGDVMALSTPAMIALMERTSMMCVQKYLPEDYTTVGTLVNVKHVNPAPVRDKIRVESRLVRVEGRRLVFEVKAYYKNTLVGEGVHERFIVSKSKFVEKLKRIMSSQA